jgi:2-polyprenyl-3-methyl-5-hydroxy-6-metoxy-1,4-benzoquinol methylase
LPVDGRHTSQQTEPARDDWDLHWSQYASVAELNPAQDFRRRLILRALAVDRPGARVLDIGSGTGDLAAKLVAELPAPTVRGLELSATGVELARRKVAEAEFMQWDLLAGTPVGEREAGWADHAVCSEVLEHVDDPVAVLANARAFLAPGCRLVLTVPGGPMSAFDRHIGHRRHFKPAECAAVLAAAGYEVESAHGAGFPFFNLYRLAVIAAGRRLIGAETGAAEPAPSRAQRIIAGVFRGLLSLNRGGGRLGFQTVAVARNPGSPAQHS